MTKGKSSQNMALFSIFGRVAHFHAKEKQQQLTHYMDRTRSSPPVPKEEAKTNLHGVRIYRSSR